MIYVSKKDPEVKASLVSSVDSGTTIKYISGPDTGKTVTISNSTLKRWWSKDAESTKPIPENEVLESLGVNMEQVNKPYAPDVTPHYIKKPKSVINYENAKRKKHNFDLPEFEELVSKFGFLAVKVNSNYIKLADKSTLWRKESHIALYAAEDTWKKCTDAGLESKPNNDKDRPFGYKIESAEDYKKLTVALLGERII